MLKKTPVHVTKKATHEDLNLLSVSTMDVLEGYIKDEIKRYMNPDFVPETQASSDEPSDEPDFQEPSTTLPRSPCFLTNNQFYPLGICFVHYTH